MSRNCSLLTLPREIRDEIYNQLLDIPDASPSCPAETGSRYREAVADGVFHNRNIFYPPPNNSRGSTTAMSQCNRQIRHEIVDFTINTYLSKGETCELDVMLQDCNLLPTWTKPPHSVTKIEHLEVNLRLFDVKKGGGLFWGNGGPGLTFVVLFRLMNRLIHHGPGFLYSDRKNQTFDIQNLTLNVLPGYGEVFRQVEERYKGEESAVEKCKNRIEKEYQKIYQWIASHLRDVVCQGLLSGKIQTLKVRYGDSMKEYDTDGIPPNDTPSKEWKSYGFVWGIDERMEVEKTDYQAYLRRIYPLQGGKEEGETESKDSKADVNVN